MKNNLYCSGAPLDGLENLTIVNNAISVSTYDTFDTKFNDTSALTKSGLVINGTRKLNEISSERNIGSGSVLGLIDQIPGYAIRIISPFEYVTGFKGHYIIHYNV